MKTSLAYTPDYLMGGAVPSPANEIKEKEESKPPVYYPTLRIEGKAADKLCKGCMAGDEVTATVTLKIISTTDRVQGSHEFDRGGSAVEMEVLDIEIEDMEEGDKEVSAEEAIEEYHKGKK